MIEKSEILSVANKLDLNPSTIEKDYVLGWILSQIFQQNNLKNNFIFKGGTCLKKCFFGNYRFSEDLDFTLYNDIQIRELEILLEEVLESTFENSGIYFFQERTSLERYKNLSGGHSTICKIYYKGPLSPKTNYPMIKLDITADEVVTLDSVLLRILHQYSDSFESYARCYSLEEIFSEKLRALYDRMRPRDLYDVVKLYIHWNEKIDTKKVLVSLKKKCEFKRLPLPSTGKIKTEDNFLILKTEWESMLQHQIKSLEPIDIFWDQISRIMEWLELE